uniref:HMA3 n=1 Tax=Arundo donax TaxID=35708 RepID=A0A0A8ZPT2_ARUDO
MAESIRSFLWSFSGCITVRAFLAPPEMVCTGGGGCWPATDRSEKHCCCPEAHPRCQHTHADCSFWGSSPEGLF